ncbi:MAG: tyrosine-type recombinase/integrase [Bacteroidaceae bacterium]|nr:tyrosine-type recombinase/integrase [Bacteroidaceae bacterium]
MTESVQQIVIAEALEDFLYHCRFERKLDEKTIKAYRFDIEQFAKNLNANSRLCDITRIYLKQWIASLSNYRYKTIKRKIASVNALMNYMEEEWEEYNNPLRSLHIRLKPPVRLPVVMTKEEMLRVIDRLDYGIRVAKDDNQRFYAIRDKAIIELLFGSGMRIGELCGLRNQDVDLCRGQVRIIGKGNKERIVDICLPVIMQSLKQWVIVRHSSDSPNVGFFTSRICRNLGPQTVRLLVHRLIHDCSIEKNVTPHTFRHTFATLLLEENIDIANIQHILGHSSIATTQIYLHVNPLRQREILTNHHPRSRM